MGSAASVPKVDGSAMGVLSAATSESGAATSDLAPFGFDAASCVELRERSTKDVGPAGVESRDGRETSDRLICA